MPIVLPAQLKSGHVKTPCCDFIDRVPL